MGIWDFFRGGRNKKEAKADSAKRKDGYSNSITGLGTTRDKRYYNTLESIPTTAGMVRQYDELYSSDDIAAKIAGRPAREATREWIKVSVDSDDENIDQSELIDAANGMQLFLQDIKAQSKTCESIIWSRVTGGSVLFPGIDDGGSAEGIDSIQHLKTPLNEDGIRELKWLKVFDRQWVDIAEVDRDPVSENFGKPLLYRLRSPSQGGETEILVHHTRIIRFDGPLTSAFRISLNGGWNDSVYARLVSLIYDFGVTWASIGHSMQEMEINTITMKGFRDAIASNQGDLVTARLEAMDMAKSVLRILPLDADGESLETVARTFSGIPEIMDRFMYRVAGAAEIPATFLFGMAPGGLNATGESDIRNFYDTIKAFQETELRDKLERLIKLCWLAANGPTAGKEPEKWSFSFNPLWQLDDEREATLRKTQAETDQIYIQNGVVTPDEIAQSRFGGDVYSTTTELDDEQREADKDIDKRLGFEQIQQTQDRIDAESMKVQTIIFDKEKWTEESAKKWLGDNGYHFGKVDVTESSLRFRQKEPGQFETLRTIEFGDKGEGIKAVVGR